MVVPALIPAVAYYRMSRDRQEASIPAQRAEVRAYAERNGYEVIREYEDPGVSGDATEQRHGFQQMLRDAREKGDFEVILCWDQDRFGRFDPIEGGYWIKPLRDAGVRLETVAQGKVDWDDFAGRIIWTVTQEAKHAFLRDMSRNVLRGMLEGALRGDWLGGKPPYGFRAAERPGRPPGAAKWPKVLVPGDPAHVEVVRWLFRTYAEKDVSLRWLGDELYRRGVLTATGRRTWTPSTVRGILTRREYVGDIDWGRVFTGGYYGLEGRKVKARRRRGGKPKRARMSPNDFILVEGAHEPLIDRPTWERVQAKLADNRTRTTPQTGGGPWLLAGLMTCGHCGSRLVGSTNSRRDRTTDPEARHYICNGYHTHGLKACHRHQIKESAVVRCIVRKLQEDFLAPDNLQLLRDEIRRQEQEAAVTDPERATRLRAQIDELARQVETGTRNMALAPDRESMTLIAGAVREWREERERLAKELARLERGDDRKELEELVAAAEAQLWKLREAITSADPAEVRAVLREVVVKVELRWECLAKGKRQRCRFANGLIHLRPDVRINRLVAYATASLWL